MRLPIVELRALALCALGLALAGCSLFAPAKAPKGTTPSAEELLREGDSRLGAGEFDLAAETFGTLLEAHPQSELAPQAMFQLTAIYLSRESPLYDPARGSEVLARVASGYPGSPVALAADAVLALLRENRDLRYEDVVPAVPAAEVLTRRGGELLAAGDVEGAATTYREILDAHPESRDAPRALFQLALIHLDPESPLRDRREGEALLARLDEAYPSSTWAAAGAALRSLARTNVDLRRAVAELRDQLERLKKIDLEPDG